MKDLRISETVETLKNYGAKPVTTEDLLAVILDSPVKAKRLLHMEPSLFTGSLDGLKGLLQQDFDGLKSLGLTPKEAARILASIELGERTSVIVNKEDNHVTSPSVAANLLMKQLSHESHERFFVVMLNTKNRITRVKQIAEGSLTAAIVHPREVFAPAVSSHAACIIAAHNHPSGDPGPSRDDNELTEALRASGEVLGIPLLDHIIIGDGKYYSYKEHGAL